MAQAFQEILNPQSAVSIHDDFFHDLGGNSLHAARLVPRLRDDPACPPLPYASVYEAPTVAELARRVGSPRAKRLYADLLAANTPGRQEETRLWPLSYRRSGLLARPAMMVRRSSTCSHSMVSMVLDPPRLYCSRLSFVLLGMAVYTPLAVLVTAVAKRTLIGTYCPLREPVWGSFYVRHWMVHQVARLIPWSLLAGTEFQCMALRALGARIGQRVHIHRGVNLSQGGWDLFAIADDVTIGQDAMIGLVELEEGCIVVGPVVLGKGATLDVRAGVGPHTELEPDTYLSALSSLPAGG